VRINFEIGALPFANLAGLENLRHVGNGLFITNNSFLTSLSGLEGLRRLRKIEIKNNPSLTSLSGIDSVEFFTNVTGYWAIIENNPLLSLCGVQSVCNQMAIYYGWTILSGNAEGCNSSGQVLESCGLSDTDDKIEEAEISIYPNPTSGVFVVETQTPNRFKAQVLDGMGRLVETQEMLGGGVVDLSDEAEGVYFVRLLFDEWMVVRKIVKI
ncbi:MAG: T9SS type A sorting domain-containing protein, partial [Bacteroidota bacterium]